MNRISLFISMGFLFLTNAFAEPEALQFRYGRYIGGLQMAGPAGEKGRQFAVTLDTFVVQTGQATNFPKVHATLRVSLGGFSSSEYLAFHYEDPTYNFEENTLYLEDANLDLSATLKLKRTTTGIALEGEALHRPSQKTGKILVKMDDDEVESTSIGLNIPYIPKLAGEYEGLCDSERALLQIETGKNWNRERASRMGLEGYIIMGRMGYWDTQSKQFATGRSYSSGTYYLFEGKLQLMSSKGTLNCEFADGVLRCTDSIHTRRRSCSLRKRTMEATPPQFSSRRYFLKLTPEQKALLPEANPPENKELMDALRGSYFGYLHHENRDEYQPVRLNVVPTTSTENPHNPNEVFVTTSLASSYGSSWTSPSVGQEFSRRTFYLRPGFTLEGPNADTFLVVDEWKKEFIRGVWYSNSFGRVGTFELIKGIAPEIPSSFKVIPDLDGEFQGPTDRTPATNGFWWLRVSVPPQIPPEKKSTVSLLGEFQPKEPIIVARAFESSAYDIYTNSFNWVSADDKGARLFSGSVQLSQELRILWPGAPIFSVSMENYGAYTYRRVSGSFGASHGE